MWVFQPCDRVEILPHAGDEDVAVEAIADAASSTRSPGIDGGDTLAFHSAAHLDSAATRSHWASAQAWASSSVTAAWRSSEVVERGDTARGRRRRGCPGPATFGSAASLCDERLLRRIPGDALDGAELRARVDLRVELENRGAELQRARRGGR